MCRGAGEGESVEGQQEMKWSIAEEGKDALLKRERTTQQLDAYSGMGDLLLLHTLSCSLSFPPDSFFLPPGYKQITLSLLTALCI